MSSTGAGLQSTPFVLTAGSAKIAAGVHTFGYFDGGVRSDGHGGITVTATNTGCVDLDSVSSPWLITPAWALPGKALAVGVQFKPGGGAGQYEVLDDNRTYSAQLAVVSEPAEADGAVDPR